MAQQVSPEAAAAAFRQAYSEAADTGVLLRARVAELEAEVAGLRKEITDLRAVEPQPATIPGSVVRSGAAPAQQ